LPRLVPVLTQLIGPDVKAVQSMLFVKAGGKPGQAWHQDEYFIPTRDRSLTAAWTTITRPISVPTATAAVTARP
jgi:hypothetical protein